MFHQNPLFSIIHIKSTHIALFAFYIDTVDSLKSPQFRVVGILKFCKFLVIVMFFSYKQKFECNDVIKIEQDSHQSFYWLPLFSKNDLTGTFLFKRFFNLS